MSVDSDYERNNSYEDEIATLCERYGNRQAALGLIGNHGTRVLRAGTMTFSLI